MKSPFFVIPLFIIALVLLQGCSENRLVPEQQKVKIGVIVPLSGPLAAYGIAVRNGLELSFNDSQNKSFELIYEDSEYDPAKAITAYQKLSSVDHVAMVINFGNPTTKAITPLSNDTGAPIIAFGVNVDVKKTSSYEVRALKAPQDYMINMQTYLRQKGYKKIGLLVTQNDYLVDLSNNLKTADGQEVFIIDTFQWGDNDFRTAILKAKQNNVDAIGVLLAPGQISRFFKQLNESKWAVPTFGSDFFEDAVEVEQANNLMEGTVYSNFAASDDFTNRYDQIYHDQNQIGYAGASYDIGTILWTDVNFQSKDTMMSSLRNIKNHQGVLGNYSVKETDTDLYFDYPLHIRVVRDGKFTNLN